MMPVRRDLPSGTITFLFTDVEGSTKLLNELGDAYADLLEEHRRVLRDAFARHGGVEVDTQGDSFFVAFRRASDAVAAAADVQRGLREGPVRVRIGIHTGEPIRTEEGYVGLDVVKAARIEAAGRGGQVLLSKTTRELVETSVIVRDLGEHRLRDIPEPIRLFQLGAEHFPLPATLNVTNLPTPSAPLVGREKERADVLRLFRRGARLITLTGAGGVGKTRFGIDVGLELLREYRHGVWFVDLASIDDPELLMPVLSEAVGARGALRDHLVDKEVLLLLDNFEHLSASAAELGALLAACPKLRVLTTSREPLNVSLEREYV